MGIKSKWIVRTAGLCLCLNTLSGWRGWPSLEHLTGPAVQTLLPLVAAAVFSSTGGMVIGAGLAANALVVASNDGCMPVREMERFKFVDMRHCMLTAQTRLTWLADVHGWPGVLLYSVGDVLLLAGFVWCGVKFFRRKKEKGKRRQAAPTYELGECIVGAGGVR